MTDDRAQALLAMDLAEVPAYSKTTLWSHLQDALQDRAEYKRLAEHAEEQIQDLTNTANTLAEESAAYEKEAAEYAKDLRILQQHGGG